MKLNAAHRKAIIDKAVAHAFDKRDKAHENERKKFADALYAHHYGDAEKIATKLPDEWRSYAGSVGIQHPDFYSGWRYGDVPADKANSSLTLSKRRLVPHNTPCFKVSPDHPLYDRATDLGRAEVALKAERSALRLKLETIVNAANTLKQLAEQWPAGAKFFPSEEKPAARALVPANLINEVNATLGVK